MKKTTTYRGGNRLVRSLLLPFMLLLGALLLTLPAYANTIHTVDIWVELQEDGSAIVTERWDITMDNASNTEFYIAKHNLDNMRIVGLTVAETFGDGSMEYFDTLSSWNVNASRADKAGKAGLVSTNGGYEVCWGFGELGRHQYALRYTITNIVKGYGGGDAMTFNFLSDAAGGADTLNITIAALFPLEYPETRIWVYGYEAESAFQEDGTVTVESTSRFRQGDYAAILLVLEPGLLSPTDTRSDPIDDIIARSMEGSIWAEDYGVSPSSSSKSRSFTFRLGGMTSVFAILLSNGVIWMFAIFLIVRTVVRNKNGAKPTKVQLKAYADVDYCRELPFGGSLPATYMRLYSLSQVDEGAIIGCFLLEWVRTGQVTLVTQEVGLLRKKEETALKINPPETGMHHLERRFYDMMLAAAGSDQVLQTKEFEKWARKNYAKVGSWLSSYRNMGRDTLERLGCYHKVPVKRLFGLVNSEKTEISPKGEELTTKMFGFLRYLKEFTILNEREAKEVALWDKYLIFAQLFGIADQVASQFKQLYPDFFVQEYSNTDFVVMAAVTTSFTRSAYQGYRSGKSAAESSSSSSSGGGGSSSSSGGGGGSSGGGGAGGR